MTIERQLTNTIVIVSLLAALAAAGVTAWSFARQSNPESDANAVADAMAKAITSGTPPKPLLETFAESGSIRAATLFDGAGALQRAHPLRVVDFVIADGLYASADEKLLHAILDNLMGNAFKFTGKRPSARIEVGARTQDGAQAIYVRDNGAGFPPEHAAKMFRPFQRLHSEKEFHGTGIGLATVQRIVQRHGGRVWAEGEPEKGATVYFTTGSAEEEWAA
jgi:signal transduction histidine kinase